MRGPSLGSLVVVVLVVACGGPSEPALAPTSGPGMSSAEGGPPPPAATEEPDEPEPEVPVSAGAKKSDVPDPPFKENGSVAEAIDAVPQGTPRLNIDQEDLGRPLGKVELYEACNPGSAHFKAKVAVWNGKAVGLDLTTTPKNQKLADCIAGKIRGITWPDKVKALNIVEYTF